MRKDCLQFGRFSVPKKKVRKIRKKDDFFFFFGFY